MNNPPGYHASVTYDRLTGKWTGNPIVIRLIKTYGEMLERAPEDLLLVEIRKMANFSPDNLREAGWRNEALVVLAHALAD